MIYQEAVEWLMGQRSMTNIIPQEPFETWQVRIAEADAAMTKQAYWIARAHEENIITEAAERDAAQEREAQLNFSNATITELRGQLEKMAAERDSLKQQLAAAQEQLTDPTGHGWRNVEPAYTEEGAERDAELSVGVQAEIGYTPPETVEQRLRRKRWM